VRVLTVGNLYPPHHFGGYEQVWRSAVRHLRDRGDEVHVLATGYRHPQQPDGDEPDVFRSLRAYWQDHDFAPIGLRQRLEVERHNHRQLAIHLEQLEPDVLSFWSMGGMSHSLIEAGRRRGLPMVAFVHDQWLDYGRSTDQWTRMFHLPVLRPAGRVVQALSGLPTRVDYGAAGRYVFVSGFIRDRALALGLNLTDTAIAPSGIAPVFGAPAPRREWQWRLLHVGRLHPDKGIEEAVRCLLELPRQATLTLAGHWDPRDESALDGLVAELGLESRVTMLGQLAPEDVAALYRSSDTLLFPVRWDEPWGLVPLESMACGCPVIATGRGGSAEYLRDGENCLLVPAYDPPALAGAVLRLAGDAELRDFLADGGAATASRYTEAAFNTAVQRHLREVAGRPGPAGSAPPVAQSAAA
jgi:glycosyltransferase involved in cell wall biosynthesis